MSDFAEAVRKDVSSPAPDHLNLSTHKDGCFLFSPLSTVNAQGYSECWESWMSECQAITGHCAHTHSHTSWSNLVYSVEEGIGKMRKKTPT